SKRRSEIVTSWLPSGYGNGASSTGYTALKIVVVAPMPSARVRIVTTAKLGLWRRRRRANRTSAATLSTAFSQPYARTASRATGIPDLETRGATRRIRREAAANVLGGREVDVVVDLVRDLLI